MEAFKGRLSTDGNRADRAKLKAGFTARRMCRAVGKPELSEPTVVCRTAEDYQIKVTPGIGSDSAICGKKELLSNLAVMREMYG